MFSLHLCFCFLWYCQPIANAQQEFNLQKYKEYLRQEGTVTTLSYDSLLEIIAQKDDIIRRKDELITLNECTRKVRTVIEAVEYECLDPEFVKQFNNLSCLVSEEMFWKYDKYYASNCDKRLITTGRMNKISQRNKFKIFLEWIMFSNEYKGAILTKIPIKYQNGSLSAMAEAFRRSFPEIKRGECKILVSYGIGSMYRKSRDTVIKCAAYKDELKKTIAFIASVLKFNENKESIEKCENIFFTYLSKPYDITSMEKDILESHQWFD